MGFLADSPKGPSASDLGDAPQALEMTQGGMGATLVTFTKFGLARTINYLFYCVIFVDIILISGSCDL